MRLFEVAEITKFNRQERIVYEESLKNYRDWYSIMTTAEQKGLNRGFERGMAKGMEKGIAQGIAEGVERGRMEEKREIARSMLKIVMSTEQIAAATGLPIDMINNIT